MHLKKKQKKTEDDIIYQCQHCAGIGACGSLTAGTNLGGFDGTN